MFDLRVPDSMAAIPSRVRHTCRDDPTPEDTHIPKSARTKKCRTCGNAMSVDDFHTVIVSGKPYLRSNCKLCHNQHSAKFKKDRKANARP